MLTKNRSVLFLQDRNRIYCILAILVLFSSGFGVIYAATAAQSYFYLMRIAVSRPVSIVGSITAVILPYVVSVLVVTNFKSYFVYPVVAVHIFMFSCASWVVTNLYGTAGWLVGLMLQFPHVFLLPMLLQLSIGKLGGKNLRNLMRRCLFYIGLIGIINYCAVSSFLAKIMNTYETMGRYANSCWT